MRQTKYKNKLRRKTIKKKNRKTITPFYISNADFTPLKI